MTSQVTHYCFRANADGEGVLTAQEIIDWCHAYCKEWAFQKELSDTGYIHWQGHIALIKKRTKSAIMERCWSYPIEKFFNYFEPTANETIKADICKYYVTKADTRIEGPWSSAIERAIEFIPKQYRNLTPRPYQQEIIDDLGYVPRIVNLLFDPTGNAGKTTTAMLALIVGKRVYEIENVYSYKDIRREVFDALKRADDRHPDGFFIDLPRAIRQEALIDILAACEKIKDGKAKTDRYNSAEIWRFDAPSVWVFANVLPSSLNSLSKDRWVFWEIEDNHLKRVYFNDLLLKLQFK